MTKRNKLLITDISDVPPEWIFAKYFQLDLNSFDGNRIKILSPLNPDDSDPSMSIYYSSTWKEYRFKCFSTGEGGSATHLLMKVWKKTFTETAAIIENDYQEFISSGGKLEFSDIQGPDNYVVDTFDVRQLWNQNDVNFWYENYGIGSDWLRFYNVWPLDSYTMKKPVSGEFFTVQGEFIYGYFNEFGQLCKIYQPKKKKGKFIKIADAQFFQGQWQADQHRQNNLIITSSYKDIMALSTLGLRVNIVAPDSESASLTPAQLKWCLDNYSSIAVYFDSDSAGRKAMERYLEDYGFPMVYIPLDKDPSDVIKNHGSQTLLMDLVPKLDRAFNKYDADISRVKATLLQNPNQKISA